MKSYIISYDLTSPGRNYDELYEKIKEYSLWARPLESVWLIKSDSSAKEIKVNLSSVVDSNDKLFVAKLTGEASWLNLSDKVAGWIKENL